MKKGNNPPRSIPNVIGMKDTEYREFAFMLDALAPYRDYPEVEDEMARLRRLRPQ